MVHRRELRSISFRFNRPGWNLIIFFVVVGVCCDVCSVHLAKTSSRAVSNARIHLSFKSPLPPRTIHEGPAQDVPQNQTVIQTKLINCHVYFVWWRKKWQAALRHRVSVFLYDFPKIKQTKKKQFQKKKTKIFPLRSVAFSHQSEHQISSS